MDTWHVMGMRGTGSCDIVLTDVFVDDELTLSMLAPSEPPPELPIDSLAVFPWQVIHGEAVVSLGIAAAALDAATLLVKTKVPANAAQPAGSAS